MEVFDCQGREKVMEKGQDSWVLVVRAQRRVKNEGYDRVVKKITI